MDVSVVCLKIGIKVVVQERADKYCRGTDWPRSLGVWEWLACSLVPVAACWYRLLSSSLVLHREVFTVRTSLSEVTEDFTGAESTVRG